MLGFEERGTSDVFWRFDLFLLLSLDWTRPFLSDLDLEEANPESLRWVARRFVERFGELRRLGDNEALEALHLSTWQEMTSELSDEAVETVFRLGSLPPIDQELWWTTVFQAVVFEVPAGVHVVPWPFGGPKATLVWEAIQRNLRPGLRDRIEQAPLGEEDHTYIAKFGAGRDRAYDPADSLLELAQMVRFGKAWREIEAALNEPEIEEFVDWARRQAFAIGIPSDMIERPKL